MIHLDQNAFKPWKLLATRFSRYKTHPASIRGLMITGLWLLSVALMAQQPDFIKHSVTTNFTSGFDVIAEDINRDGHFDIVACAKTSTGEVSWWKNDGNNAFSKIVIKQDFEGARSVRACDMNGDGEVDIVAAAWQANTILYFENTGNEIFIEHVVDNAFTGAHTVDLKDMNADGRQDILCSGFDFYGHEGEIAWWENDGAASIGWTKHLISDRFQQSPFIYGEDMDGDGDPDVVACGELNNEILWWENDGSGNFIAEYMVDSLFTAAHTVLARDVDLDGDMDILGAACMSSMIAWYENDGSQTFTKHSLPSFAGALWLDATDIDEDGDMDLFGAGMSENQLSWWENDGSMGFTEIPFSEPFTQAFCMVPVQMDNDGDVDFVAIGYASNTIAWFENTLHDPIPYANPESCVYDYTNERWLIANTGGQFSDGNIVEVDQEGVVTLFKEGLIDPLGMCIAEGVLYVSEANEGVYGFDLETATEVFFMAFSPGGNMDGQAYDQDGHLYVVDTQGRIHKIYLEENFSTTFVSSGLYAWTQDIVYDAANNCLYSIAYYANAPIQKISLEDSSVTNYPTTYSQYDGITIDQDGNVYLASHQSPGRIIKYFSGLNGDHEIVSSGHNQPAGLFYNMADDVLAVPNFGGSTVDFLQMGITGVEEKEPAISNTAGFMRIVPNPCQGRFRLESDQRPGSECTLEVFSLAGERILSRTGILPGKDLDLRSYGEGLYILRLTSGQGSYVGKLIINH